MISRARRTFIIQTVGACAAVATLRPAEAAAPMVDENDPTAKALGYRTNAVSVDARRFPKFQIGQRCANCTFYAGVKDQRAGLCVLFPGKSVEAAAWCNGYQRQV